MSARILGGGCAQNRGAEDLRQDRQQGRRVWQGLSRSFQSFQSFQSFCFLLFAFCSFSDERLIRRLTMRRQAERE